jgi:hypothetical protein
MRTEILDPGRRPDWDDLLRQSGDSCFFHSSAWAEVLRSTYGFRPQYFAVTEAGGLSLLMPFMEVDSALTGKRGVSLPFTDYCPAHARNEGDLREAAAEVIAHGERAKWKYAEWRDAAWLGEDLPVWESHYFHEIDLRRGESDLFASLSDNNRRNIRKAGRSGVAVRVEQSAAAMSEFYRLNVLTRKRHGLPPQPRSFFRNVFDLIIAKDMGAVVTATYENRVVAASVYFCFGERGMYKYGASDLERQELRPNNILMWEALLWLKSRGLATMDLGRTELPNEGLLRFKRTWGAKESLIRYYRYSFRRRAYVEKGPASNGFSTKLFQKTPKAVLRLIGRLLYRHVG